MCIYIYIYTYIYLHVYMEVLEKMWLPPSATVRGVKRCIEVILIIIHSLFYIV